MKIINFAVVKFSLLFALGIIISHYTSILQPYILQIISVSFLLLFISWYIARKRLFQNIVFGIVVYICFIVLGYFSYQIRLPSYQSKHYTHFTTEDTSETFQLTIKEILKPTNYTTKYIAEVNLVGKTNTTGKVLINLKKDSISIPLAIDQVLLVRSRNSSINTPKNPHQFNYSKYMEILGVYGQLKFSENEIIKIIDGKPTLRGKADKLRNFIINKLKKTAIQPDERSIIQALILGEKKDISKELYNDYAAAGAIHILAVSGLHVGILYFIFSIILSPLKRIKNGLYLHSILIILLLWCFAFLTGLSPSVTRAVTMFSFFAFADSINRQTSTINTLFLSFFVLLLYNPLWLFHVGFQLSYLAVLAILLIYPKLKNYYTPRYKLDKLFWNITTVSIAAQIGIIPLSLYYFNQFPGLFIITNIAILPFLGILLGSGIFILLLATLSWLPDWIAIPYNYIIENLNAFISWVANQESFLFIDIHFSRLIVLSSYLLLISMIALWKLQNFKRIVLVMSSVIILLAVLIEDKYSTSSNELIIFNKTRKTLIGSKENNKLKLFLNDTLETYSNTYPVQGYRIANNISSFTKHKLPSIFKHKNTSILVLDSIGVYPKASNINIILLTQSPKIHLGRLIDSLNPKLIVADGSNYNSYISRWEATCKEKEVPFHHTGTKGALIIE
jgi:competence protein ComEC